MAEIRHNVVIKASPEKIFDAITTQQGLENWWAKQTTARPEVGFVNVFTFGTFRNEMEVTVLIPNKRTEWKCLKSIEDWVDTSISFDLQEKDGRTVLRFAHSGWRTDSDVFAGCNHDWGRFLISLKSLCETGTGAPA